ncbi:MAG: TIGR01244 family sulfur transferase [Pseudomonadota bacterium]
MDARFSQITENFWVGPQVTDADLKAAADAGVSLVISNRMDGEEPGQPLIKDIETRATGLGLSFVSLPVGPMGINEAMLNAFQEAVDKTSGGVLAYCKSGFRSVMVRAMASVRTGTDIDTVIQEALGAGFDIRGHTALLEAVAPDQ